MTRKEAAQLSAKVRRLPESIINQMKEYRKQGYAYNKIALIMNENVSTIFRYCNEKIVIK